MPTRLRIPRGLFAVLLFVLTLSACSKAPPPLPHLATDATVLAFGDSLTHGTGVSSQQSYPAVLQNLIDRRVINAGVPGEVTEEGLQRLPEELDEVDPQLVILCLGGNDMIHRRGKAQAETNLAKMITLLQQRSIPVVLLGVPQPAVFGLKSAGFYRELAKRFDIPLEDDILPEVLGKRSLKSDTIHPNAEGYRRIAEAVRDLLKRSGAI